MQNGPPTATMDHIGTVSRAALLASQPGLANGRPAKAIVPTIRERDLPSLFVPEIDRDLPSLVMFWEGGSASSEAYAHRGVPVLRRPFTDAERSALEVRIWSLTCAVAPSQEAHRDALLAAIVSMLGGFPAMQRYDELTGLAIAAAYLWSARERPHWAILKACGLVRSGTAGLNRAFCPSEPEFNAIAERCADAYVSALRRTKELRAAVDAQTRSKQLLAGKAPRSFAPAAAKPRDQGDGAHASRALADLEARRAWRDDPPLGG
jgi:hypothetical protein